MAYMPLLASRRRAATFAFCLLSSVAVMAPLSAGSAETHKISSLLQEGSRLVPGGRSVEVVVSQGEIKPNAFSAMAASGGAFGGLLGASIDAANGKEAEQKITVVRDTLLDFDADGLAIDTTRKALAKLDWMQPGDVAFSKDSTARGYISFVNAGAQLQAAFFRYSYEMATDFTYVRVTVNMRFTDKAQAADGMKPDRLLADNTAYMQTIVCDIALPKPDENDEFGEANAALWAADDGKLVKQALVKAFSDIETFIPRTLALTDADFAAMSDKSKPKQEVHGANGRVLESDDGHLLIWNGGFVQSDTLQQNP